MQPMDKSLPVGTVWGHSVLLESIAESRELSRWINRSFGPKNEQFRFKSRTLIAVLFTFTHADAYG